MIAPRFSIAAALLCATVVAAALSSPSAQTPTPASGNGAQSKALLTTYCTGCHNQRLRTGGLSLDDADVTAIGANAAVWEKVAHKLRSGQMPPFGRPRPEKSAVDAFLARLEHDLDEAALRAPNPGRPVTHRLTRTEYANAVRDLLAIEVDARSLLPADDTDQHGFDNNSEVLSLSPVLLERYLSAARTISRMAVGRPPSVAAIETYTLPGRLMQDDRADERLPFGSRGGAVLTHNFPADGDYTFTIHLQKTLYNAVRGLADPHQLELRLNRERVHTFTVGGAEVKPPPASFAGTLTWNPEWEQYANHADENLAVTVPVKAGTRSVGVTFVRRAWEPEDVAQPPRTGWGFGTDEMYDANPSVESVTIEGPFKTTGVSDPATGAGPVRAAQSRTDTPSRQRIFSCLPRAESSGRPRAAAGEEACARTILATLARRAYRRPVTADDVDTLIGFYRIGRETATPNGSPLSFDAGIETALQRMLVSPDFLFRIEQDPARTAAGSAYRVSDVELASRLSFFLWSSIPDDALLDRAAKGALRNAGLLEAEVRRMLRDPRAKTLVENFASQWLQLRDLRNAVPDPDLFAEFDENLREAFRSETELFIGSQLQDDRAIPELLTADYSFLNERLARHYGVPGVSGSRFRRVSMTGSQRSGLLGQGSVLTITSYPNRTSPVLRGKWLLENILGTPPPPPPPDVPALSDKGADGQRQSVRERLEAHRRNPACATCHAQMDPLGFALERFDAIGALRTRDDGNTPIDASGSLPDGQTFEGLDGLRSVLVARQEQFVGTVAERLMSYALGRGIEYYDRPTLRRIVRDASRDGFRWSSVVIGIVSSAPFQMRRSES
jgi:mono/diheme cytochrome c family protein